MKFSQEIYTEGYAIRAYTADSVTVTGPGISTAGRLLKQNFLLSPEQLLSDWPATNFASLAEGDLEHALPLQPELILLGTGSRFHYPPPRLLIPLQHRGIGIEVMDSGAACRTYNVLASEGRRVVAAILLGPS